LAMKPGDSAEIAGYTVNLHQVVRAPGPNYESERGVFEILKGSEPVTTLTAERRFYPVQQTSTSHTGIWTNLISNLYIALGEPDNHGKWTIRLYHHPMAPSIWFGFALMAVGGFVSLSDRRFRIGAPQRARPAPAIAPVSVEA